MKECLVFKLGLVDYLEALSVQMELVEARINNSIPDVLLLLEHPHVYTIGRGGKEENLLVDREELRMKGIDVLRVNRGGDVTYHGPGQLVGYPIMKLGDCGRDVLLYLRKLEQVLKETLNVWGIDAQQIPGLTGVWVGDMKIGAIGVGMKRWVTFHGFALNVFPDLSYFRYIVPCGITKKGVTSLENLLKKRVNMEEVMDVLLDRFGRIFRRKLLHETASKLEERIYQKRPKEYYG